VRVRHARAGGRIDDRKLSDHPPAVVEPQPPLGAAPYAVAGKLQRTGDVSRELGMIQEELEDVGTRDEWLTRRPGAD
jgi:hypothetical protein